MLGRGKCQEGQDDCEVMEFGGKGTLASPRCNLDSRLRRNDDRCSWGLAIVLGSRGRGIGFHGGEAAG